MTTNTAARRTPLHDATWTRSASGRAIRTRWRSLHVSLWRRNPGGPLAFTISGTLPAEITTGTSAIGFVWDKVLRHVGQGTASQ